MNKVIRHLHLVSASSQVRKETYRGREYTVVPVVALIEGVIWPVNSETPEYVPISAYSTAPEGWNGRPVFPNHPVRGGTQVLGNTPEILETESFGIIFNSGVVNDKLSMEAWLSVDDAASVGDRAIEIVDRANRGDPIEISVGATVLMEEVKGTFDGQDYFGKWVEVFPDHLALLEKGFTGACSIEAGCGVRMATAHRITDHGYETVARKEAPLAEPAKPASKTRSLKTRLMGMLRTLSPAGWSDTEVRSELTEALCSKEPNFQYSGYVVDVFDNEGIVIYSLYDGDDWDLYARTFTWTDDVVTMSDSKLMVEATTVYIPDSDADDTPDESLMTQLKAAQVHLTIKTASSCGCGGQPKPSETSVVKGANGMDRNERITALIAAKSGKFSETDRPWLTLVPDSHLVTLEEGEKPSSGDVKPNDGKTEKIPTTPKTPDPDKGGEKVVGESEEQFLANHPHIKSLVDRQKAQDQARRQFLIGKLKSAQSEYSESELATMSMDEIERVARLCKAVGPEPVTDFSGIAGPRAATSSDSAAPMPPDMNAAVRAAAEKRVSNRR